MQSTCAPFSIRSLRQRCDRFDDEPGSPDGACQTLPTLVQRKSGSRHCAVLDFASEAQRRRRLRAAPHEAKPGFVGSLDIE